MGLKLQGIARANSLCIARAAEAWFFELIESVYVYLSSFSPPAVCSQTSYCLQEVASGQCQGQQQSGRVWAFTGLLLPLADPWATLTTGCSALHLAPCISSVPGVSLIMICLMGEGVLPDRS